MTTERVLIVEDDPHLLKFVEDALKIADYEVRSAGDGEEALAVLARWRPHVILLDLNMPRMDGLTAARRIRQCKKLCSDVLIVAVTAFDTYGMKEAALEAGCNGYITKPLDFDRLEMIISRILFI